MSGRYVLEPHDSRFTVQAFATGMLSAFGHNPTLAIRDFAGQLRFPGDATDAACFEMTVRADSLELIDRVSPKDRTDIETRMRQEVLESRTYPTIQYRSTNILTERVGPESFRARLVGELSLHGIVHVETIDADITIRDSVVQLSGGFWLRLSTYGLQRVSALGGLIRLKDELKFLFDIHGRTHETPR